MTFFTLALSFLPFIFIFLLILPLYLFLYKLFKRGDIFVLLLSLLLSPLILGALLYLLFFVFPGQSKVFYIIFLSLFSFFPAILSIPKIGSFWLMVKEASKKAFSWLKTDSPLGKMLIICIISISFLIFIRSIFWPINWDDQIYYIEQSYVFGQIRSLSLFSSWGHFRDSYLIFQMNPAIRPGLPMIFTQSFLFSNNLYISQYFCQTLIYYYFIIFCSTLVFVTYKFFKPNKSEPALLALFLTLTTYLFTSHTISGFKEIILIPITLLAIYLILNIKYYKNSHIALGIMFGLMSFVNYSGIIISLILALFYFAISKENIIKKTVDALTALAIMTVISCFEVVVFFNFVIQSFTGKSVSLIQVASSPAATVGASGDALPAQAELAGYGINSSLDLFTKGKLQGLFQPQFYGLIFVTLLIVILIRYKNILKDRSTRVLLLFFLCYVFIIFDPFGLNRSTYAYVLSVSHKYTVFLVPFAALMIASQWQAIKGWANAVKPIYLFWAGLIYLIADFLYIKTHMDKVFDLVAIFMPVHDNRLYYLRFLRLGELLLNVGVIVLLLLIAFFHLYKKTQFNQFWKERDISLMTALVAFFLLPFCFFFNTNYGFKETALNTFSSKSVKLSKIHGWGDSYDMVNRINLLPKDEKILFYGVGLNNIEVHLTFPKNNIFTDENLTESKLTSNDLTRLKITYLYANVNVAIDGIPIKDYDRLELISQEKNNVIYKIKASN